MGLGEDGKKVEMFQSVVKRDFWSIKGDLEGVPQPYLGDLLTMVITKNHQEFQVPKIGGFPEP